MPATLGAVDFVEEFDLLMCTDQLGLGIGRMAGLELFIELSAHKSHYSPMPRPDDVDEDVRRRRHKRAKKQLEQVSCNLDGKRNLPHILMPGF